MTLIWIGLGGLFAIWFYFAPAYVASKRHHPSAAGITIVNLLLGWTVLGWIVALAWATSEPRRTAPAAELAWQPDETRREYEARVAPLRSKK